MGIILIVVKALTAAFGVWKTERQIANRPDLVKEKTAQVIQDHKDALAEAEEVLADPNASPKAHAEALRKLRLGQS